MDYNTSIEILERIKSEHSDNIGKILDMAIYAMRKEAYQKNTDITMYKDGLTCCTAVIYGSDFVAINNNDGTYKVIKSIQSDSNQIMSHEEYLQLLTNSKWPLVISKEFIDKSIIKIGGK